MAVRHEDPSRDIARKTDGVAVRLSSVNERYGEYGVFPDIDLGVSRGAKIVVCGPSVSGKSTTILGITRLEEHRKNEPVACFSNPQHERTKLLPPTRSCTDRRRIPSILNRASDVRCSALGTKETR